MYSLFICNTPYQILTAIGMKYNMLKDSKVDIIVSNHFNDGGNIYRSLKNKNIFDNVYYVESLEFAQFDSNSNIIMQKIKKILSRSHIKEISKEIIHNRYDKIYFSNRNWFTVCLYSTLKKNNKLLKAYDFEEGYSSYIKDSYNKNSIEKAIFKVLGVGDIFEDITFNYYYEPGFVTANLDAPAKKINKLNKNDQLIIDKIKAVFDINNISYNKKFIFFEEAFIEDGYHNNDLELVMKVANVVGKDNLIVKSHPRVNIDRFKKLDIEYRTEKFPWEAYCFCNDMKNKVFISIFSGACISTKIAFEDNTCIILLYKIFKGEHSLINHPNIEDYINKFKDSFGNQVYIPESIDELELYLNQLK